LASTNFYVKVFSEQNITATKPSYKNLCVVALVLLLGFYFCENGKWG